MLTNFYHIIFLALLEEMVPYHKQQHSNKERTAECKQIHFLLCGSCFWCASYIDLRNTVEKCPSCMNGKVESMPLSDKEIYTFRYDAIRGVTFAFKSNR